MRFSRVKFYKKDGKLGIIYATDALLQNVT